jgi:hypothetical protein
MNDPEPNFGRPLPEGTFGLGEVYRRDASIDHAAAMTRLLQRHDVAREAEYIARVAVGQDPLKPAGDRRRDKRPRVVEDLFKRLCWMCSPDGQMKMRNPELFGPDGERWITRREIEHLGDKRVWGGKYTEDQIDAALIALESQGIIERNKAYNPSNRTSKIAIRVCPLTVIEMLAAKKEASLFGDSKSRKRVAPLIASDVIFLKTGMTWQQAIYAGEKTRAAASELYYEPALNKYLTALTACIKGLPCGVPDCADRRISVEDVVLVEFLKVLLKKWRVNPKDHEFRYQGLAFTRDGWRAFSHDELTTAGFTEAQIVRCKRLLVTSGILEWVNLPSPGKGEPRIYARLRVDLILIWIREFEYSGRFTPLPKAVDSGWIPSVIHPRSSNTLICALAVPGDLGTGVRPKKKKLYPADAGSISSISLTEYSTKCRAAMLVEPSASGDPSFRAITRVFTELFTDYFAAHPLDHQVASRIRAWVHRGALSQRMTLNDLLRWHKIHGRFAPGNTDGDWKLHQIPKTPEEMLAMLKHWPGIKHELNRPDINESAGNLEAGLKDWGEDHLPYWESDIRWQRFDIESDKIRGRQLYWPRRDDHRLPMLVALQQLGLHDDVNNYIRDERAELQLATKKWPGLALSLLKHYPDLMQALDLPPEHWAGLRRKRERAFYLTQVQLAKQRLWNNELDDLNAAWVIDPVTGLPRNYPEEPDYV